MARRGSQPPSINYPEGDHVYGVVFYRIDSRRLDWETCKGVIRAIAEEFIREGPFLVRTARREVEGRGEYWIGFNAEACGQAFERDVDIRANKITKALRLPGRNSPPRLGAVLSEEDVRRLTSAETPEPEWGDESAAANPSPNYVDHYFGVAFYRLVREELDPQIALEAVKDAAIMLLQPMGSARPIVLRCRLMSEPPDYYWVALNNPIGAILFERMLTEQRARVKKQTSPPAGFGNPTLRSVFQLDGVPVQPPGSVPAEAPPPRSRRIEPVDPMPVPEPVQAQRDRLAWARSVDVGGAVARLRARMPRRRRREPEE